MNKFLLGLGMMVVFAIAFGATQTVYAQSTTPPSPTPSSGYGFGMTGGHGGRGGMMNRNNAQDINTGFLHDGMLAVFAEKLDLSTDEINSRLENGETMALIASSAGLTSEEFTTLMIEARTQAIDQAVQEGILTQTQADWMKQRGGAMGGGMHGANQRQNSNSACPYSAQTQQ